MEIRRSTETDIPQLALLESKCFGDPWSGKGLRDTLREERSFFLTAVENGRKPVPSSWLSILSEQYNLSEQQLDELRCAFNDTIKQVRISLDGAPSDRRDLALSFARRFDELDHEDIAAFMDILSRK